MQLTWTFHPAVQLLPFSIERRLQKEKVARFQQFETAGVLGTGTVPTYT